MIQTVALRSMHRDELVSARPGCLGAAELPGATAAEALKLEFGAPQQGDDKSEGEGDDVEYQAKNHHDGAGDR
jgi:hypothetical protein